MKKINVYIIILVVSAFIGGLLGSLPLLLSSLMAIFLILLLRMYNKYIFNKLKIKKGLSQRKVEIGESLYYNIELENRKLIPVLFLSMVDKVSRGLSFVNDDFLQKSSGKYNFFNDLFSLKWYERINRYYEIKPRKRGLYYLGSGTLNYSGLFGLFENSIEAPERKSLIVFPRVVPVSISNIDFKNPFGTRQKQGWIFKDRLNKVGVRPYQSTDNIKQINWKASARHQKLESDVYKPSFERELHIFLNVEGGKIWIGGFDRNTFELSIISVASLIRYCLNSGYIVGFHTNGLIKGCSKYTSLAPDENRKQEEKLLTTLAMLQPFSACDLERVMEKKKKIINKGATVVVITSDIDKELKKSLIYYRKQYKPVLIFIGEEEEDINIPGIYTYCVNEGDKWDEIKNIQLV